MPRGYFTHPASNLRDMIRAVPDLFASDRELLRCLSLKGAVEDKGLPLGVTLTALNTATLALSVATKATLVGLAALLLPVATAGYALFGGALAAKNAVDAAARGVAALFSD